MPPLDLGQWTRGLGEKMGDGSSAVMNCLLVTAYEVPFLVRVLRSEIRGMFKDLLILFGYVSQEVFLKSILIS